MGMFDEVGIRCPKCKHYNYIQSKAGPCHLITYSYDDVPDEVAQDISGSIISCECCDFVGTVMAIAKQGYELRIMV